MCYFASISTRLTSTETANYPGTELVGVAFKLIKRKKFTVVSSLSSQNLEFDHFTSSGSLRNEDGNGNENVI